MMVVALGTLILGLILGVWAMLYGTERQVHAHSALLPHERQTLHDVAAEPSPLFNRASFAAFCVAFGLTGYVVSRSGAWAVPVQVTVAGLAGGVAMALQSLLIARWAIPSARSEQVDERYVLQGTLATIIDDVPAGGAGRLHYRLDGRDVELPARAMDDSALTLGSDVVIDRVEDDIAYVELWTRVESRL
jgi:hypothetical protein